MICFSGLDLIGGLLANDPELVGLTWCAFGDGDAAWDAQPPLADRGRTALTHELARVPIAASALEWRPTTRSLRIRLTLPRGVATGTLREFGLFGGDASARPGSGLLLNHKAHDPVVKAADETLDREIAIQLADDLSPGARDLIGQLLGRQPAVTGLTHVAYGSSAAQAGTPGRALQNETFRVPIDPRGVAYDQATRSLTVSATLAAASGRGSIKEIGLVGGDPSGAAGSGFLVDRIVVDEVPGDRAVTLTPRFRLHLASGRSINVPDVTTGSLDEARVALAAVDLAVGDAVTAAVANAERGRVVTQTPAAGTSVEEGTTVALEVASGDVVVVPATIGRSVEIATAALEALGCVVDEELDEVAGPAGLVLASSPTAGTTVAKGSTVELTVSSPPVVTVPNVRGRTKAVASLLAHAVGLTVSDADPPIVESRSTRDTVVTQDPAPGTHVPQDRPLRLTVAAPFTVAVPDLSGVADADVAQRLTDAAAPVLAALGAPADPPGLAVGSRTDVAVAKPDDPLGVVVGQRPAPGTAVPLYGSIEIDLAAALDRPVPRLTTLTEAAARAALAEAGYAVGVVSRRETSATTGTVVDQDPASGASWPAGGRVSFVVAAARTVRTPSVVGLPQAAAREAILGRGLLLGTVQAAASGASPGFVIGQNPAASTVVAVNSSLDLVVAAGVPAVVGMTRSQAEAAIAGVGLVSQVAETPSDALVGTVLSQDPAADSAAGPGSVVTIGVAVARTATVPPVIGLPVADAEAALNAESFVMQVSERRQDAAQPDGTVLAQDPESGQPLTIGGTVNVVLAVAPQLREVPQLVGSTTADADARSRDAGFHLTVVGEIPTLGVPAGAVAQQVPVAGSQLVIGSAITVWTASADQAVDAPDLRGFPQAKAEDLARSLGLSVEVGGTVPSPGREGLIVDQDPQPGTRIPLGSPVRVIVGVEGVTVPNVVGTDEADATSTLNSLGLQVVTQRRLVVRRLGGTVIDQRPAADQIVNVGDTVTIGVATGFLGGGHTGGGLGEFGEVEIDPERFRPIVVDPNPPDPIIEAGPFIRIRPGVIDSIGEINRITPSG